MALAGVLLEEGGAVDGHSLVQHGLGLCVGMRKGLAEEAFHLVHTHLVLRQGTCLVGADDGGGAHGLAGVHFADEVVRLQHTAHTQGQGEGDGHRQTLGHGYNNERHGHHDALQGHGGEIQQVEGRHAPQVEAHAAHDDERCQHVTDARDNIAEAVELVVERCLDGVVNLCGGKDLAVFGLVAHGCHLHHAVAVHHGGASQGHIGGIGGFGVSVGWISGFLDDGLARECGFVHLQGDALQQFAVSGHLGACIEHNDVAHDDIGLGHFGDAAVANDLHKVFIAHGIEEVESTTGLHFKPEADARGQDNGHEDAGGLEEDVPTAVALAFAEKFKQADTYARQKGEQKDADNGVLEFFKELPPQRSLLGRR